MFGFFYTQKIFHAAFILFQNATRIKKKLFFVCLERYCMENGISRQAVGQDFSKLSSLWLGKYTLYKCSHRCTVSVVELLQRAAKDFALTATVIIYERSDFIAPPNTAGTYRENLPSLYKFPISLNSKTV